MNCETYCALCYHPQFIKINFSKLHGICETHFDTSSPMLKCIHCRSIAPILIPRYRCVVCSNPCNEIFTNSDPMCYTCQVLKKDDPASNDNEFKIYCDYCLLNNDFVDSGCEHKVCFNCWKNELEKCPVCTMDAVHSEIALTHSIPLVNFVPKESTLENNYNVPKNIDEDEISTHSIRADELPDCDHNRESDQKVEVESRSIIFIPEAESAEAGFFCRLLMRILHVLSCFWIFGFCFDKNLKQVEDQQSVWYKLSCIRLCNNKPTLKKYWRELLVWECCEQPTPKNEDSLNNYS